MKNYVQKGDVLNVTLEADAAPGEARAYGKLVGVFATGGVTGDLTAFHLRGVYTLNKTAAQAWGFGDKLYFLAATQTFTNVSGGGAVSAGFAAAPAAAADTEAMVLLSPGID
jgi:predicted RecA/RadA family phage recombinase